MADTASSPDNTWYGVLAIATGMLVAFFVHFAPQSGDAPAWVGDACAAAFVCAGIAILSASRGWPPLVGKLAGLVAAYMLVVPGIWIVFGGDPARCSVSAAFGSLSLASDAGAMLCKSVFGGGALLTLAFALLLTVRSLRRSGPKPADQAN
jgi:hypothetical protein